MRRLLSQDENPADVITKIDDFIMNPDNTDSMMEHIGLLMKTLDKTEQTVNNLEDEGYRNEMLGYIMVARTQTMNILDALDSMLEV